jgi:hypothetical protein
VTPISKKSTRNNVEDYRGVAKLSAIPKRFELLVYKTMYCKSTWLYEEPIDGDELVGVRFLRADGFRLHGLFEGF